MRKWPAANAEREAANIDHAGAIFARLLGMLDLWLAAMPNGRVATP
jgi:hypothetical protein